MFWQKHKVVELLLAGGADPCAVDRRGMTTVHMAAGKGFSGVLTALLEAGARDVMNYQAAQLQDTPMLMACAGGHLECVKVLQKFRADIGVWSVTAENCVDVARRFGHRNIVEYLLDDMTDADAAAYREMWRVAEERHRRVQAELVER